MFNNPFESFHDTVAKAKAEREQIDRLLTISTPHERLLFLGSALLLCVLLAWFVFGELNRHVALTGSLLEPIEGWSENQRSVQAQVWIRSDVVDGIGEDAAMVLELLDSEDGVIRLEGSVAELVETSSPSAQDELRGVIRGSLYRVELLLDDTFDFSSIDNQRCRVIVESGNQSPLEMIGMRRL